MSTASEREQILNEYGAWVEEKTLEGLNLTVEAYLAEVEAKENAGKIETMREAAIEGSTATFLRVAFKTLGFKEALDEQ